MHMMLLLWVYKTHVASESQGFREPRPTTLQRDGAAGCARQRRDEALPMEALYHLGAALCCSWQGTSAAPGILSRCLRAALIYAWLPWPAKGCPSQGNGCFPYLLAVSHRFHPKPGLGQQNKDCYAYAWHTLRSQLYRRL